MNLTIQPVRSAQDFETFLHFPWKVYQGDKCWVPPVLTERRDRLDPAHYAFWKKNARELWVAWRGKEPVGTILASWNNTAPRGEAGFFGFFEALQDPQAAALLLSTAASWLREKGAGVMRGPYNPSRQDELGILIYGFNTRPSILEGHNPPYYRAFFEENGFQQHTDLLARICKIQPGWKTVEEAMPERLNEIYRRVTARRKDLLGRPLDVKHWQEEIDMARDLYNRSLADVRGFDEAPADEFRQMAEGFRPIILPDLALVAELAGKPVGFALALPDVNEALQPLNGRLGPLETLSLAYRIHHVSRASFKILVLLPEYQGRGFEAVLIHQLGKNILKHKFHEVDMSLTGDDNPKSSLFQDHLGFKIYRRYRVYQKELTE